MNRFCVVAALVGSILDLTGTTVAWSQTYPNKIVKIVVPFPAGGAVDVLARLVGDKMQKAWGQSVIIDNKPGAGTVVGTNLVAKSPPDGYTMGFVVTAHVINPSLVRNLPYDTVQDLAGITQVAAQHIAFAAYPGFEANSIGELVSLAKKNPGRIAYATPGNGSSMHLATELLKATAGIDLLHVPYKGSPQAEQDVMSGRVPVLADVHWLVLPLVNGGKLKLLGLFAPHRPKGYEGIPVVGETVPGVSAVSLIGMVIPGGTPRQIVHRIGNDIGNAIRSRDVSERMVQLGMEPIGSSPEEFDALIRTEITKWQRVVKISGAVLD